MVKYKLGIEYVGTNYSGWQKQDGALSVQQVVEEAFFRFCGEVVECYACGRTDAGVHALCMSAHIELSRQYDVYRILMGVNFYLRNSGEAVVLLSVEIVDADFHARFSCTKRHYLYRILNRNVRPVLLENRVWWVQRKLDAELMNSVAKCLIGKHNFSTFRASECQAKSPVKTLSDIAVSQCGDEIDVRVSAPSFLYHQVRNIVGTLSLVGMHKWSEADFLEAFNACDRTKGGPTAPACGLYFEYAEY